MMLDVDLHVKFRVFGITFGTVKQHWLLPVPIPVPVPPQTLISFNERGVQLTVKLV